MKRPSGGSIISINIEHIASNAFVFKKFFNSRESEGVNVWISCDFNLDYKVQIVSLHISIKYNIISLHISIEYNINIHITELYTLCNYCSFWTGTPVY